MNYKYFSKVFSDRSVIAYFVVLFILFGLVAFAFGFAWDSYQQAEETKQKIASMQKATETYALKKALLEKEEARPIQESQVDEVQTAVLLQIQSHGLELSQMSSPSQSDKEKARIYDMELRGSYEDTMEFISTFRQKTKALIAIMSVNFRPDKEAIKTSIKYKLYVR
ncbi:MAG: hypothetical protein IKW79_00815 [Schwartzia sp.]|nr:hypothetical protein [Schwartzia sp. (in: firmicutes)]